MGMSQKNILGTWIAGRMAHRERDKIPILALVVKIDPEEYDTIKKISKDGIQVIIRRKKTNGGETNSK